MEFAIGGLSAVCAGFFTNPLEVLKTRMQLQGEMQAKGQYTVHYRNIFHAAYNIVKNDGIFSLQKGLIPALWVQFIMNGTRLGLYQICQNRGLLTDKNNEMVFTNTVIAGGICGMIGQYVCTPMYLIKTHLQSQAVEKIAVGHQHKHQGTLHAFNSIFKEQGIKGLFRGAGASLPRGFLGSTSQLTSFSYAKQYLDRYSILDNTPILKSFFAAMIGGVAVTVVMNPCDLILTRICNQPVDSSGRGVLYSGYLDCTIKICKSEGVYGFYKGIGPNYIRLGPHTVLHLVFWDALKRHVFINKGDINDP
ncbi:solute carrier family 25 member 35-like [Agrilus planipennis]|uniref:Solute carrier family 25 member 35-like n=1 Tax=Agrilus planipennis TaxID=224129 RepID=A0A1W4WKG6_AGRPL|nr:solute carrier family 25 member 35-like [Agrilus planipennis]